MRLMFSNSPQVSVQRETKTGKVAQRINLKQTAGGRKQQQVLQSEKRELPQSECSQVYSIFHMAI